jgi:hypothetical protein
MVNGWMGARDWRWLHGLMVGGYVVGGEPGDWRLPVLCRRLTGSD